MSLCLIRWSRSSDTSVSSTFAAVEAGRMPGTRKRMSKIIAATMITAATVIKIITLVSIFYGCEETSPFGVDYLGHFLISRTSKGISPLYGDDLVDRECGANPNRFSA